jgi:hypothetical protein
VAWLVLSASPPEKQAELAGRFEVANFLEREIRPATDVFEVAAAKASDARFPATWFG